MKNNKKCRKYAASHPALSWVPWISVLIISLILMACTTTSFKPGELEGSGFSRSGCAVLRNGSVFSGYRFWVVTPQNSRYVTDDAFVAQGTRVAIEKVESSWDLENGYRMRLYLRSPIVGVSHDFFIEHSSLNKDNIGDFVNSILRPCN